MSEKIIHPIKIEKKIFYGDYNNGNLKLSKIQYGPNYPVYLPNYCEETKYYKNGNKKCTTKSYDIRDTKYYQIIKYNDNNIPINNHYFQFSEDMLNIKNPSGHVNFSKDNDIFIHKSQNKL